MKWFAIGAKAQGQRGFVGETLRDDPRASPGNTRGWHSGITPLPGIVAGRRGTVAGIEMCAGMVIGWTMADRMRAK